ncbi:hypothetical protein [Methylomicrobium sp. Wu6]|uniref:hypothetical protein n=1 Tax=Methylomicrobium sp. Wu6 TaxID=3107928 RepID=UPI002DD66907|nr:hypothetical protein [Methylomicrobium sp. Wu6]MEC4747767.1 hypothetical protein [Methylomicrobium sp. Wu6]
MSKINICFVANYYKTYFFHEIATHLQANGIDVCWIVVNRKLRDFLIDKYGSDAVLYLSKDDAEQARESVGDFRLNELVHGDRALRYQVRWAYSFLNNIQQPIYEFLKQHDVRFVFGEITWAHEILIHRVVTSCQELKAVYYCPHTIRMPTGRFGFFRDEYQSELVPLPTIKEDKSEGNLSPIIAEKPDYLALNDMRLQQARTFSARLSRLKRYFTMENIDAKDPTLIVNRWLSFRLRAAEEINRELYHLVPKASFDETLANRNFVFLGLHKQPEASIDVIGRYYENQFYNIVNIWRALPDGWLLLVKEHSNAVGDRSWGFYRKLRQLRNVVLVDEQADSHTIIRRSRAVVTVSGTMAYESALMGIPSLTFGDVFFNQLPGCRKIGLENLRAGGLHCLVHTIDKEANAEFTQWLNEHSAEGCISDPVSNRACMNAENIKQVVDAFIAVIK